MKAFLVVVLLVLSFITEAQMIDKVLKRDGEYLEFKESGKKVPFWPLKKEEAELIIANYGGKLNLELSQEGQLLVYDLINGKVVVNEFENYSLFLNLDDLLYAISNYSQREQAYLGINNYGDEVFNVKQSL